MSSGPALPRRIAHFDLDSFFVAVERTRDASLRGKPVLVGHPGPRGVVATASYEARRFGCHSAQPMVQAMRLCPQAVVVPPHFEAYQEVSGRFHAMLRDASPVVESVGIDEAYVDLTGLGDGPGAARAIAEGVRRRVRDELGVTVSACVAGSRTTAKVGSDRAKPDGLIEVPPGGDAAFLAPLPIRDLPLVGPKLGEALRAAGVRTIGEAAALDARWLAQAFGQAGALLHDRARGVDPSPVEGGGRPHRSISREVTFGADVTSVDELRRVLARHAERVGADLRRSGKRARTVTLKLRWNDFTTLTRARTVDRPVLATQAILEAAEALLDELLRTQQMRPVRLLGLGVTNLGEDVLQLSLDDTVGAGGAAGGAPGAERAVGGVLRDERLDETIDALRGRFGESSVRRGWSRGRGRDGER